MNLNDGLFVVVVTSLVAELLVCLFCWRWFSFVMAPVIPFIVAVSLFWLPNLDHLHEHEARGWFIISFIYWFVPSAAACLVLATAMTWLSSWRKHRADHKDKPT